MKITVEELVKTPNGVAAVAAIRSIRPEPISPADLDFLLSPGYMAPETGLVAIGVRAEDRANELEYPDAESGQQSSIPPDCGWTTEDVTYLNRRYALQLRAAAHAAYFLAYALMPKYKDLEVGHLQDMHKALETLKGVPA